MFMPKITQSIFIIVYTYVKLSHSAFKNGRHIVHLYLNYLLHLSRNPSDIYVYDVIHVHIIPLHVDKSVLSVIL